MNEKDVFDLSQFDAQDLLSQIVGFLAEAKEAMEDPVPGADCAGSVKYDGEAGVWRDEKGEIVLTRSQRVQKAKSAFFKQVDSLLRKPPVPDTIPF